MIVCTATDVGCRVGNVLIRSCPVSSVRGGGVHAYNRTYSAQRALRSLGRTVPLPSGSIWSDRRPRFSGLLGEMLGRILLPRCEVLPPALQYGPLLQSYFHSQCISSLHLISACSVLSNSLSLIFAAFCCWTSYAQRLAHPRGW